jgi:hypothetical protein
MVNDPTLEPEKIGREPMGDPAETEPEREGHGVPENPDDAKEGLPEERPNT